jgi:hypothetical protein
MKFIIDRPITGSYVMEIINEESNDFLWKKDEEKRHYMELDWIEPNDEVISGYVDVFSVCHRLRKETLHVIEVNTLEELHDITVKNGKIVFDSFAIYEGVDGWIEIYDDYRE